MVAVGGRGTLVGAVLGGVLVSLRKTYTNNDFKEAWPSSWASCSSAWWSFCPTASSAGVGGASHCWEE